MPAPEHCCLADLGWAGVIFEYGVVGGLLILLLYIVAIRQPMHPPKIEGTPSEEELRQVACMARSMPTPSIC